MSDERLSYGRQSIDEDDIQEVADALRSGWLTQGPRIAAFEASLCEATGARHAVAVCNGTAALHLAALALGVREGDVGIVPAITFLSSAHCVRYAGGEVEFADVEPDTALVSVDALQNAVHGLAARGKKPKIIVPVDLAGQPSDWSAARRIADETGARLLLDAAHSLGAETTIEGSPRRLGESGADAATLSFHPVKHATTAEGGAVITNDEGLYRELAELRTFGMHKDAARFSRDPSDPLVGPWYYETNVLAYNFRLSDVHAALGVSQMRKLGGFLSRRRAIAARYDAALAAPPLVNVLAPLRRHAGRLSAYHLYVVRVLGSDLKQVAEKRRALFGHLQERNIHCQVHYVPVPWQPYYRALERDPGKTYPGAERYYASAISLPMYPALTDAQVDRVIDALRSWVEHGG